MEPNHWIAIKGELHEWLVIEHADGRLEDKGFVVFRRAMPLYRQGDVPEDRVLGGTRWSWKDEATGQWIGVYLRPREFEGSGQPRLPMRVEFPDGTVQLWHIRQSAHRVARKAGLMVELPTIEALCE